MPKHININILPEQLAEDFKALRTHLSNVPGAKNFLVGPDSTQPEENSTDYLKR